MTNVPASAQPTRALHARAARGFTLIEAMITVALIAILAAIALPSYQEYMRRSYRAEARAGLQEAAMWMERSATANGIYPMTADFPEALKNVPSKRYTISLASATGATWTLTATRAAGTGQATDRCGNYTLTQSGNRQLVNNAAGTTVPECWDR